MTRRTFTVIDIVEILLHWSAGRNRSEVARSLGVDRGTVAKYTAKAEAEGYAPTAPRCRPSSGTTLVHGWFPELVDPRERSLTHETIEAHRTDIEEMLKTNTAHDGASAPARRTRSRPSASRASAATCGGSSQRRSCATSPRRLAPRSPLARRLRSTTATSARGSTRWPTGCGGCGRSSWCSRVRATCSSARAHHGPAHVDAVPRRGVRLLRWRAAPPGERQPEDRGDQARHLRPQAQPLLRRVRRPLRLSHRPGPGPETQGQAPSRADDALRQGLYVERARLGERNRHGNGGAAVVQRGGR